MTGDFAALRVVEARGLRYGLRVAGADDAPAVFLLHGFAGSSEDWNEIAPVLAGAGFRVVAADLPGHGATGIDGATAPMERFSAAETARDLVSLLDDLSVPRAHWLGYSMGGRIALISALTFPARAATLTLESASPGLSDAAARDERRRADDAFAAAIVERGIDWFADSWAAQPLFASQRSLPVFAREAVDRARRRNSPAGLSASLRAAGQGVQPYVGDRLGELSIPVLLVTGSADEKYGALARSVAPRFGAASHAVIDGAGHNVHLEQPERFTHALLDHLTDAAGGACEDERRDAGRSTLETPATS